jgi:hypothetical protein
MVTCLRQIGGSVHRRLACRVSPNEQRGRSCHAGEGSDELSATARRRGRYRGQEPAGMVPGPDRAAIFALVGRRAVGPQYPAPARISMEASVSGSERSCVRSRRIRRGPPAGRRPPPAAGRPASGTGYAPGLGARASPCGQDAGAAGSRPASRLARIAGPAVPRAGTDLSIAPRITAAQEPHGPGRADQPRRPARIIVAVGAANPHRSPPAGNVAAASTTPAAGDDGGWDTADASAVVTAPVAGSARASPRWQS